MHQASPGVERAVEAARAWAQRLGATALRLTDLVLGLLDEEEGRPAVLLERLGISIHDVRRELSSLPIGTSHVAPPLTDLYDAARDWSLAYRADPAFMTDAFLVATLQADPAFTKVAARFGVDLARISAALKGVESPIAHSSDETVSFELPDATAEMDAARVIDANLNRSREALRVLDDYCRFVLGDRFLTETIKGIRHELAEIANRLPPNLLLHARETLQDVGTSVSTEGEYHRTSPAQVALINWKRLQESLRSLEEFGKMLRPDIGRDLEALRYRTYTLERVLALRSTASERLFAARLYVLLTGSQCTTSLDWLIEEAAGGGVDVFQLREKELSDRELLERARNVRRWTKKANVLFIVNDRPDIAKLVEADGVHLGQDDMPVHEARRILGPGALIGVSTHSIEQVRQAALDAVDYIGIGPTFRSKTKAFDHFPGLSFVRAASAETSLPAFALGGIGPENVGQVVAAGCRRIAVSSAIAEAEDPQQVARILRASLDK